MVSHPEICIPKKPPTPKNIGRQFRKEDLFVQYDKNKNVRLLLDPISIKPLPEVKTNLIQLLIIVLRKVTVMMHGNVLSANVQMGVLRLKV